MKEDGRHSGPQPASGKTNDVPSPSAEERELAKEALELFGAGKSNPRYAGDADLQLVVNAVTHMKARTSFPTRGQCETLLDACRRLADKGGEAGLMRAVAGSRVLFEYERAMLSRGYQRYGGVLMDQQCVEQTRALVQERARQAARRNASKDHETDRVIQEFTSSDAANKYADSLSKKSEGQGNHGPSYFVKGEGKRWSVCARDSDDEEPGSDTSGGEPIDTSGYRNLGHVNPWGAAGGRVVGRYSSIDEAYRVKKGMQEQYVGGTLSASEEQVINAGNAVMTIQRPPEYRIVRDPDSRAYLVIEQRF